MVDGPYMPTLPPLTRAQGWEQPLSSLAPGPWVWGVGGLFLSTCEVSAKCISHPSDFSSGFRVSISGRFSPVAEWRLMGDQESCNVLLRRGWNWCNLGSHSEPHSWVADCFGPGSTLCHHLWAPAVPLSHTFYFVIIKATEKLMQEKNGHPYTSP